MVPPGRDGDDGQDGFPGLPGVAGVAGHSLLNGVGPPPLSTYPSEVFADSPALWWKLDDASGQLQDSSGHSRHSDTLSGAIAYHTAGPPGVGSDFSGHFAPTVYAQITSESGLDAVDNWTVEGWFFFPAAGSYGATNRVLWGNGDPFVSGYGLFCPATGITDFYVRDRVGGDNLDADANWAFDTWYYVVIVRTAGLMKMYINGVAQADSAVVTPSAPAEGFRLGGAATDVNRSQDMNVAQIAVYQTALTPARIAAHYTASKLGVPGSDGDFWLDTASLILYGPKAGGVWPTTGTSIRGRDGVQGRDGDDGDQGSPGPTGAPGAAGVAGSIGTQGPVGTPGIDGEDAYDWPILGQQGPQGVAGAAGSIGSQGQIGVPGADGEDAYDWPIVGAPGAAGVAGVAGAQGAVGPPGLPGADGDDGQDGIPGARGVDGATGAPGTAGAAGVPGVPGVDGEDAYDWPIIGPPGVAGANGAAGVTGPAGLGLPGLDGDDGMDGWTIVGPQGPAGAAGSVTYTTVEVSLGAAPTARRSGHFDITTAGLTSGKPVHVLQAHGPYTGKGTLADEAEMDSINCSGKTISTTVIRVYWEANHRVRGNYKFDYLVGA